LWRNQQRSAGGNRQPDEPAAMSDTVLKRRGVRIMCNRRIALKATVPLLTASVVLGMTLSVDSCWGSPTIGLWVAATSAVAQSGGGASARRTADDLLRESRAAIKRGDYPRAESLISDAEKLGVTYDQLLDRWSDTPDTMRKLLAQERSKANAAKPGMRLPAIFGGGNAKQEPAAIPSDPVASAQPINPQTVSHALDQVTGDQKSRAVSYLKDARAALARRDKLAALAAWQKAAAAGATFGPGEDSPQLVASELERVGIDKSQLKPASTTLASPYALRPADIDPSADRLPQLGAAGAAPPAAVAPTNDSPYSLPPDQNPLARSPGGTAFQPLAPPTAAAYGPAGKLPSSEPQRLPTGDATAPAEASRLVSQSRLALDRGDLQTAARLAEQAEALNVPDNVFAANEIRPWQMSLEVNRAMVRRQGIVQAGGSEPAPVEPRYPVAQGVYNPAADTTQLVPANNQSSVLNRLPPQPQPGAPGVSPVPFMAAQPQPADSPGVRLFHDGLQALQSQDRQTAIAKFTEAWRFQDQLDPDTRQQLKDKLTYLRASSSGQSLPAGEPPSPLEQVNSQQELLRQKLVREILNEEKAAQQQAQKDPRGALASLQKLRERVATSEVEPAARKQLLTMVDRLVSELTTFIDQNKATIESAEQNNAVKAEVVRDQEIRLQAQGKLADMVEQFNRLMDEKRFAEAEVVARQANDISPAEPVVVNMLEKSKLAKRIYEDLAIKDRSERGFIDNMMGIGESGIPFDDRNPIVFGDARRWSDLTKTRRGWLEQQRKMSPAEQEIQRSLSKGVEVRFINRPLAEVMDTLGRMAGVNVYLDPQGLNAEGVTTDTPVTLNLTQPISLKSALNLVLSPLGLSHVIQNEVLRITSEQTRDSNTYARAYYVADLVMPIPNFVPNGSLGLPGAIRESLNALTGSGLMPRFSGAGMPLTMAKNEGQPPEAKSSADVLAQINNFGGPGGMGNFNNSAPGSGPGGLRGGTGPDFDSLVELVTSTIAPQSWQEVGGPGAISGYENNLSLVVSQTQEVHEQIADLLEQLRRLQDLQVTIEVRFITLADSFFERIGVDFDVSVDDNTGLNNQSSFLPSPGSNSDPTANSSLFDDSNKSVSIGWTTSGPTGDLDLKLTQNSLGSTTPQFGGFDPNSVANFGFAILSDIEVFFVLAAGQGDSRANILQAPKVTLFNGQFAFVSDTTQRPFVTTVIPVVGDFAAAQQPVIVVLSEGTSLSVQAVVSADRRFVRLTMVPFFSQIGDVQEFTFTGSTTTDSGTTVQDPTDPKKTVSNGASKTVSGTTVQLPTFAITTVTTTVSVPDGGTVLLGGIKRLREGRTERGVPILNKLPYISRLFKNVGIGREAQSLMMMVTPRIIIQEEEEQKLGIELPEG
jgi:general secretion pathway protein D